MERDGTTDILDYEPVRPEEEVKALRAATERHDTGFSLTPGQGKTLRRAGGVAALLSLAALAQHTHSR